MLSKRTKCIQKSKLVRKAKGASESWGSAPLDTTVAMSAVNLLLRCGLLSAFQTTECGLTRETSTPLTKPYALNVTEVTVMPPVCRRSLQPTFDSSQHAENLRTCPVITQT
jgi:hypothetical protein